MTNDPSLSVGDAAALGKLFEENRTRLLAMVRRRMDPALAQRIDPDDILTEAFLQASRRWVSFKSQEGQSDYAWLYRMVMDQLIEAWRRETRGVRDVRLNLPWPEHSSVQLGMNLMRVGTSPSAAVCREELREQVRQVMALLSYADQEILSMRHFDQLAFREIGEVLGITPKAASVRYSRALKRLRTLWQRAGHS